ncbi:MAG: hypothetical protein K6U08_03595 [Firmicutes bacterium]|nr:hypothetical protein [Bacillota bacterium]
MQFVYLPRRHTRLLAVLALATALVVLGGSIISWVLSVLFPPAPAAPWDKVSSSAGLDPGWQVWSTGGIHARV